MEGDPSNITGLGQYEKQIRLAPGAGLDSFIIGDAGFQWRPLAVIIPFTTDATAGSRRLRMRIFDTFAVVPEDVEVMVDYLQGPSETVLYIFSPGIEPLVAVKPLAGSFDTRVQTPFPNQPIIPGFTWEIDADGSQAGDLFGDASFTYLKYRSIF